MLAEICQISRPEEVTNVGIAIKPRKVQSIAIQIKAGFTKGALQIRPAAENAKTVQANIKLATIMVQIGASKVP